MSEVSDERLQSPDGSVADWGESPLGGEAAASTGSSSHEKCEGEEIKVTSLAEMQGDEHVEGPVLPVG